MDYAADIQIFLDTFGVGVIFMSQGHFFGTKGIFSEWEEAAIPMDGVKAHRVRTLACDPETVKDVTAMYTVEIDGKEYPVLATPPPIDGLITIVLGGPK